MKKNKLFFLGLILSVTNVCAQDSKTLSIRKNRYIVNRKFLIGKWQAENDNQFKILFTNDNRYIELYGSDTINNTVYRLSKKCNDQDSLPPINLHQDSLSQIDLDQAFIIIYSSGYRSTQCDSITNLERNFLSFTVGDSGRFFVFKKIKDR